MTVADLGIAVHSEQARSASTDLSKLVSVSAQAENAVERLGRASVVTNGDMSKIAAGLDKATALLERLSAQAIYTNAQLTKMASGGSAAFKRLGDDAERAGRRIRAANSNISGRGGISAGARQAAGFNAGQQLQDIFMMAALGQSPGALALQQGPQLATALQQGGGLAALRAGLMSVLSPLTLVTVGLTAAGAAAFQYFSSSEASSNKIAAALKQEKSLVDDLTKSYGAAAEAAVSRSSGAGILGANFGARDSARELDFLLHEQAKNYAGPTARGQLGRLGIPLIGNNSQFDMSFLAGPNGTTQIGRIDPASQFKPFEDAIRHLFETARSGTPDFLEFRKAVLDRWHLDPNNDAITKTTRILIDATKAGVQLADAFREARRAEQELLQNVGPNGMLKASGAWAQSDMGNLSAFQSQQTVAARRSRAAYDAGIQGIYARSPAERAAAARAQAAAQHNDSETSEARALRIDLAGQRALIEAQHQLDEAQKERKRSLDATLASQQIDLDIIGKTTGQVAQMRLEFQLTQQLREEAARNNVPVDQNELELIKQKAAAYGQMAEAIQRAQLGNDLAFERSQIFRTSGDQAIASRLRGTGLGMDSPEAQALRQNAQLSELKTASQSFVSTFASTLQSSGGNIGKSFGAALLAGLQNYEQKAIEQLGNMLFNILSHALGMGGTGAGTGSSGITGTAVGLAGKVLGGANDNYAPGAVTRTALPAIGATGSAYSVGNATSFIQQYASSIGIDPDTALKVARGEGLGSGIWQSNLNRNGVREPSFGPFQLLKGGPGTGFGRGLGNQFMAQTGLDPADPANWQQSTAFALDQAKANGWGAWYGAKAQGITGFMGIDQGASKAVGALDRLATSSVDTATSLTSGLGNLGQSLANVFPSAPSGGGGGGIFGFLGSLFGGGRSLSSLSSVARTAVTNGAGGLYDIGGFTGQGGKYDVAGLVHRGEFVFDADATARIGVANLERMRKLPGYANGGYVRALPHANGNGGSGSGMAGMHITIGWARGASGMLEPAITDVVRRDAPGIAKQQSQAVLSDYHDNMRRGAFGKLQNQYSSQKG